jgi:hypothetical protein
LPAARIGELNEEEEDASAAETGAVGDELAEAEKEAVRLRAVRDDSDEEDAGCEEDSGSSCRFGGEGGTVIWNDMSRSSSVSLSLSLTTAARRTGRAAAARRPAEEERDEGATAGRAAAAGAGVGAATGTGAAASATFGRTAEAGLEGVAGCERWDC